MEYNNRGFSSSGLCPCLETVVCLCMKHFSTHVLTKNTHILFQHIFLYIMFIYLLLSLCAYTRNIYLHMFIVLVNADTLYCLHPLAMDKLHTVPGPSKDAKCMEKSEY